MAMNRETTHLGDILERVRMLCPTLKSITTSKFVLTLLCRLLYQWIQLIPINHDGVPTAVVPRPIFSHDTMVVLLLDPEDAIRDTHYPAN